MFIPKIESCLRILYHYHMFLVVQLVNFCEAFACRKHLENLQTNKKELHTKNQEHMQNYPLE